MGDDSATWPNGKFRFVATWGAIEMHFQEVSGLDLESQPIEYRHGDSPVFSTIKMPGLKKSSNVTLKKGVVSNGSNFQDMLNQRTSNTIQRLPMTITLQDEAGESTMTWTLQNAWPTKISGTDLKSNNSEIAIETMEIAHEGVVITHE